MASLVGAYQAGRGSGLHQRSIERLPEWPWHSIQWLYSNSLATNSPTILQHSFMVIYNRKKLTRNQRPIWRALQSKIK